MRWNKLTRFPSRWGTTWRNGTSARTEGPVSNATREPDHKQSVKYDPHFPVIAAAADEKQWNVSLRNLEIDISESRRFSRSSPSIANLESVLAKKSIMLQTYLINSGIIKKKTIENSKKLRVFFSNNGNTFSKNHLMNKITSKKDYSRLQPNCYYHLKIGSVDFVFIYGRDVFPREESFSFAIQFNTDPFSWDPDLIESRWAKKKKHRRRQFLEFISRSCKAGHHRHGSVFNWKPGVFPHGHKKIDESRSIIDNKDLSSNVLSPRNRFYLYSNSNDRQYNFVLAKRHSIMARVE